ncbi:probable polygalacturonase At3g15720 [Euphorbia lathyris]|uniref:probable polygalacturonase At3g15720 n=1 Tax=Euphorbia lathyris TaxID=212925 RepID=UPI003313ADFD
MINPYTVLLLLCAVAFREVGAGVIDVINFGAVGDGITDDSQALMKAWSAACGLTGDVVLVLPSAKTFLLKPLRFNGPCKSSNIRFLVDGNIVAPNKISDWTTPYMGSWIVFISVNGLTVAGNGQIDGQGSEWWKCAVANRCERPVGLKFSNCQNLTVDGLRVVNSPSRFLSVSDCHNVVISSLTITNPETSPNTDGMDITHSTYIQVTNCTISTGDDCIAILSGCSFINITRVSCIQGHGISIGSLGHNGDEDTVEEVYVKHCNFGSSLNGAHIKAWQGGRGYVRKVSFEDITLSNTSNPINIDQFYCPRGGCQNQTNAVKISDVSFSGIRGTSFTETTVNIACSESVGCSNILVSNIDITSSAPQNQKVASYCLNAHGSSSNANPQVPCLLP